METVLLAGSTGYLGRFLLKELQKRGYPVRALARNPHKVQADNLIDFELFHGNATDPSTIIGCCDGIDVVISTIGITRQKDGFSYMDVDYQANVNLLEEARKSGVRKFIYISVLNGERLTALALCKAKELFVSELENSGLDYCVIRPNGFFSDMAEFFAMAAKGKVYLFGKGMFRSNPIHGADLAVACTDAIDSYDKIIEIGGPEILSHNEIAMLAFDVVKQPSVIKYIPELLRLGVLWFARTFTKRSFYGPLEFFFTVMAMDMIAPQYGGCTLKDYFLELNQHENAKRSG